MLAFTHADCHYPQRCDANSYEAINGKPQLCRQTVLLSQPIYELTRSVRIAP